MLWAALGWFQVIDANVNAIWGVQQSRSFAKSKLLALAMVVGVSGVAMASLAEVGADLFLAGHLHVSHIGHTAERYKIAGHSALVIQAGTMSTRSRGELNTFNVLRIHRPDVTVERHSWVAEERRFVTSWTGDFHHTEQGWTPV